MYFFCRLHGVTFSICCPDAIDKVGPRIRTSFFRCSRPKTGESAKIISKIIERAKRLISCRPINVSIVFITRVHTDVEYYFRNSHVSLFRQLKRLVWRDFVSKLFNRFYLLDFEKNVNCKLYDITLNRATTI